MAQAYIRQSTFADGDTITAALFNDEYNQLVNAFAYSSSSASSTGHRHDGTAGQGGNIFKIGDLDFLNKVEIDSTNNRVGFYVEVSSAAVEQLRVQDGALVPVTDSDIDLGTTSLRFKDTFTDSITTTGNVDVGGNLTVTGTTTFNGGTITMGDAATDNVVFGADVDSSIIPDDDDTYDLGSSSQQWRNIFIDGTAEIDTLSLNGTTVTSTAAELNVLAGVTSTAAELNILDGVTSTAAELNILDGVTSTTAELNILDGVTATTSELNILDGVTSTAAELNILDGVTSTAAELNILDGVTANASELNILDGVTSTTAELNILDGVTATTTELNLLDGVTSTTAELNILDGVTSTATELNLLDGVTATTTELNYVDVATAGTVEASKAIVVDSNKDFTGTRNITTTGSLSAGGGSTNGVQISQGAISIKNGGAQSYIDFYCEVSNAHYARLQAPAHANFGGNITLTLPATTGTLALTSGDITGNAATATSLETARTIHGVSFDGTANIDLTEVVQDTVGAMFSSNTETGIAATYEDGDGTIDLVIGSGVITNAMLAGSILNSKLANSSITVSDGSNSTATALGGTITFAGTSNEVEVAESSGTVTVGLPSNVTIGNNLTVTGNLTVSGTTTQTGPIVSDDNFTGLLNNNSGNSSDFGFFGKYVESSTTKYAGLYFDASTDNTFRLFTDTQTEPAATVDTSATGYAAANLITAGITATTGTFSGDLAVDTNVLKVDTSNNRIGVNKTSPAVSIDAGANTDAIHVPVGTTAQRPTGAAGQFRYNTTTGNFEGYTSEWGAIAGSGSSGNSTFAKDTFTGDGSTTAFTMTTNMSTENGLIVFIDGVYQADNVYSVSGTTLTFATAPLNSRIIEVFQFQVSSNLIGVAPVIATMTGDGSDTTLALGTTPDSENQTFVTIDGVVQHKDTYSISGSTLTFSTAPPTGAKVECITFTNVASTTFEDADGDTKIQVEESTDEDKIRFDTGGTERMVIDSTGVGIGTTPSAVGNYKVLQVRGDSTSNGGLIRLETSDGTSGVARLFAGSTSTVLESNSNTNLVFQTNATERMRISSGGNVGIGVTDPDQPLQVKGVIETQATNSTNGWAMYTYTDNTFRLNYNGSGSDEIVLTSSGNLFVGADTTGGTASAKIEANGGVDGRCFQTKVSGTGSANAITFNNGNGQVGYIATSGTSTSYATSSDYRLKENVTYEFDALSRVAQLKPARFNFISDGETTVDGFIAHEVSDIVPEAITGEKDGEQMQGIDQSKLVPLLTKAIQEQQELIKDLKSRIEVLETPEAE